MSGDTMAMEAAAKSLSMASESPKLTWSELNPMSLVGSGGPSKRLAGLRVDVMGGTRSEAAGS